MSDRFTDWLFSTLISVDAQHQELLRGFGALLLIPFAVFLLSYASVSFAFIKVRAGRLNRQIVHLRPLPRFVLPHRALRQANVSHQGRQEIAMTKMTMCLAAVATVGIVSVALAGKSQAEGTAEQRWACEQDAFKFCGSEIPNVPRITACMIKNVKKLSPTCRAQFKQTG